MTDNSREDFRGGLLNGSIVRKCEYCNWSWFCAKRGKHSKIWNIWDMVEGGWWWCWKLGFKWEDVGDEDFNWYGDGNLPDQDWGELVSSFQSPAFGPLISFLFSWSDFWSVDQPFGQLISFLVSWSAFWSVGQLFGQLISFLLSWSDFWSVVLLG